jgi:hypothetical protein
VPRLIATCIVFPDYVLLTACTGTMAVGLGAMMWPALSNFGTLFIQLTHAVQVKPEAHPPQRGPPARQRRCSSGREGKTSEGKESESPSR